MNKTPSAATARPTGVKSNIAKVPAPVVSRKPETIRFGGVPIRVVMPPRIEPNASGISTRPGGNPCFAATWMATGMSKASVPTLFMKAESSAPSPVSTAMVTVGPDEEGIRRRVTASIAPVVEQAAAQHQHTGHRDHRRMAESGKRSGSRHQTGQHAGKQAADGHHVVTPFAPQKHHHRDGKDDQDGQLIEVHLLKKVRAIAELDMTSLECARALRNTLPARCSLSVVLG